jgi:hypothetical protein
MAPCKGDENDMIQDLLLEDKDYQCDIIIRDSIEDHGLGVGVLVHAIYTFPKGCHPAITAMRTEKDLIDKVFEFKWKPVPKEGEI